MKHYAVEHWVDFSRGAGESEERARMHAHLAEGCPECRKLHALTDRMKAATVGMSCAQVPDSVLRLARAIFPARGLNRPRRGSRVLVELVFDSFLAPVAVGLRATWQIGWQGLYRAGECSLDLRIEPELKSPRAAVIGQVTNHVHPEVEMNDLPVNLRNGSRIVAETSSNRFGEFQMEYEQQSHLKLSVHLRDSRVIEIPLKKLVFEQPAVKSRKLNK